MKNFNLEKEIYRGGIKQLMKVGNIRKISLDNYFKSFGMENPTGVHSIRIDIQDGYVNLYGYNTIVRKDENGKEVEILRCGSPIVDVTEEMYANVYDVVRRIFTNKDDIPAKERRNILVKLGR